MVLAPSPLAGAEITTLFAPALSICALASSGLTNNPVDSMTTSTASSFHGNSAGSFIAQTLMCSPSTIIPSSS